MKWGVALTLLVVALFIGAAGASAHPVMGTEDDPELEDPSGNVEYSPLYLGPKDRHHVDLLAGWFEYQPDNDSIMVSLKLEAFEDVLDRTQGWSLLYEFMVNFTYDGEDTRQLYISMGSDSETDGFWTSVEIRVPSGDIDVPFSQEIETGTPGYLRWFVPLEFLRNWGDGVAGFAASAGEFREATPGTSTIIANRNPNVFSAADYSFAGLTQTPMQDESNESLAPTGSSPASEGTATDSSPMIGAGSLLVAVSIAFGFLRRQR